MSAAIIANGLAFDAGGNRRVGPVDLNLPATGITVLMGPNGAGKSLLLRLLHGLIDPSAGRIEIGTDQQAMVFQKPVMLRRTVAENLLFVLERQHSRAEAATRCRDILREIDMTARADQPARALSGGEQQRLALARALATGPDLLFLDEPTASLDPASTLAIEATVLRAAAEGTRIVLVTHDIGQARRVASDVVFLHKGTVCEHSLAADFFDTPASEQARAYLDGRIVL